MKLFRKLTSIALALALAAAGLTGCGGQRQCQGDGCELSEQFHFNPP